MLFSVIIPMYNERAVIADSLRELTGTLETAAEKGGWDYEIVLSDDGSSDGSSEIADACARSLTLRHGSVRIVRSEKNRGKGAAVRTGMLEAAGDWRLFTDSDLAYGADAVAAFLAEAQTADRENRTHGGCGLLIGSRAIATDGYAGYTPARRLASRVYLKLLSACAGFRHTDSQCGIKLFRADAAQAVFSRSETDGWAFDFEALMLADRMGFPVRETPVRVLRHGASKVRLLSDSVRMLREIHKIRRRLERDGTRTQR